MNDTREMYDPKFVTAVTSEYWALQSARSGTVQFRCSAGVHRPGVGSRTSLFSLFLPPAPYIIPNRRDDIRSSAPKWA